MYSNTTNTTTTNARLQQALHLARCLTIDREFKARLRLVSSRSMDSKQSGQKDTSSVVDSKAQIGGTPFFEGWGRKPKPMDLR